MGIETVLVIQHERPGQFQHAGFCHSVDSLYSGAFEPDSELILLVEAAVIYVRIAIEFQNDRVLVANVREF